MAAAKPCIMAHGYLLRSADESDSLCLFECRSPARSRHPSRHKGEGWSHPAVAGESGLRAIATVHGVVVGQIAATVAVPPKHCHLCHSTESMPLWIGECH